MLRLLAPLLGAPVAFFAFTLLPTTARAQSEPSLRFDFGVGVLGGSAQSTRVSAVSTAPALKLDLGAQLGDHAALFARVEGGTILLANEGAAYFVTEWTPLPPMSIGAGIGYEGISIAWYSGCDARVGPCIQNSWSGVSVPLLLTLNLQPRSAAGGGGTGAKHPGSLRLELEGAAGYDPRTETSGVHLFVGVVWSWT
jgi:hypothetical protein